MSLRDSPRYLKVLTIFVAGSFLTILTTTTLLSHYLAHYMTNSMMMRDAVVSMEFLNSIARVEERSPRLFSMSQPAQEDGKTEFFTHVSRLPDVFRAHVYTSSGDVLWSSDPQKIGQNFAGNRKLEATLRGELHPSIVNIDEKRRAIYTELGVPDNIDKYIEFYVPIQNRDGSAIMGAVEIYKAPRSLLDSIDKVFTLAWVGAILSASLLFSALLFVVFYAGRNLLKQEQRLIESERLAVVGEMASAVAHGLRNPLAAIRSCAELVEEEKSIPDESRDIVSEIIVQVDRLEVWIRSFLTQARSQPLDSPDLAQVDVVVQRCLDGFSDQLSRHAISVDLRQSPVTLIEANAAELEQIINSIVSNSIEAMQSGGSLKIGWQHARNGCIAIEIHDSGPGVTAAHMTTLFKPFHTTKSAGLGLGLALSRRIAERLGGTLELQNGVEAGALVTLTLPTSV